MKLSKPLVVLDLETTGVWIDRDKIIEIAMIKCLPDGTKETYDKRVNPAMPIPPIITEITGISDEDIKDAPLFQNIAQEVAAFIGDADLGGFNAERFDIPLLERELKDAGATFSRAGREIFDAQKVYHLNEKRDLTAAYKFYCDKLLENAHSALADTQATLDIIESQVKKYGEGDDSIDVLKQYAYTQHGDFYDEDRKFRWWNGKLFMMFGKYARNHTLQEVAKKDPAYLEWILSADFSEEIKELVSNALKGHFPKNGDASSDDPQGTLFK